MSRMTHCDLTAVALLVVSVGIMAARHSAVGDEHTVLCESLLHLPAEPQRVDEAITIPQAAR